MNTKPCRTTPFSELTYSLRLHTYEEWISIQEAMEITIEMLTPQNRWYPLNRYTKMWTYTFEDEF